MPRKNDGRASNGGARPGAGRLGNIPEAAYRLQQMTARPKARALLDESQLAISIAATRAALKDLETEALARAAGHSTEGERR